MAEMYERVRKHDRQRGRVQSSGERKRMAKAKVGCESAVNRPGAGSELNGHPRGYEHEPRTAKEGLQGGSLSKLSSDVESSLPRPAFAQSHTNAHAHRGECRKKNKSRQLVADVKKLDEGTGYAGGLLPRLGVHERDGSPPQRANHGDSSFSNHPMVW